jgi:hypothetical protein
MRFIIAWGVAVLFIIAAEEFGWVALPTHQGPGFPWEQNEGGC